MFCALKEYRVHGLINKYCLFSTSMQKLKKVFVFEKNVNFMNSIFWFWWNLSIMLNKNDIFCKRNVDFINFSTGTVCFELIKETKNAVYSQNVHRIWCFCSYGNTGCRIISKNIISINFKGCFHGIIHCISWSKRFFGLECRFQVSWNHLL